MKSFKTVAAASAIAASALVTGLFWPVAKSINDARTKCLAIRLHEQNWTHGQIAEELGRDPREVAQWLGEADRTRAL
nr:helix-turn-helix domain-containing protein [uncultured Brevundimonas sp.]